MLDDFRKLHRSADPTHRAWEKWLKGAQPTLQVTFEQECAMENTGAVLLSLGHPLLRQTASHLQPSGAVAVRLCATHASLSVGTYPFAVYRWTRQGARRDEELVPIASEPTVTCALLELIPGAEDAEELQLPAKDVWDKLDAIHHQSWLLASTEHVEDNRQLVGARIHSLMASHQARRKMLSEQIARASNEKIRIMKQAELERAEVDFNARVVDLNRAGEAGDIRATPAVFGVLEIRRAA